MALEKQLITLLNEGCGISAKILELSVRREPEPEHLILPRQ
jgi:hypothetical protein